MAVIDICQCRGTGWVCENHTNKPWYGMMPDDFVACCGGAGTPCKKCHYLAKQPNVDKE